MMKNLFFPTAALLALLSACSERTELVTPEEALTQERNQGQEQTVPSPATVHIVINGIQEGEPSTKTVLADNLKTVLWMPGDDIKVFCDDWTEPARFISTNDTPAVETTFEADVTMEDPDASGIGDYWAVYPYSDEARFEGGEFYASLPASQVAVDNSFADDLFVSVAHCSAVDDMHFYNVCSGFKFSLDREDITSVTFTARGGEPVAGDFAVAFDEDGLPLVKPCGTASSVTLKAPGGQPFKTDTWYYIVLLPQKLGEGFTLTFEGEDSEGEAIAPIKLSSSSPLTLTRSRFPKSALKIANVIDTDIETAAVRAFLEDPAIDEFYTTDTEYTQSLRGSGVSCTPNPVTFKWAATGARTLYISTDEEFTDIVASVSVGSSATSTGIYNLIPGLTYYCRTVSGNTYWETSFVPVGPFRALNAANNARDLGGWTTIDGYTVKYGKLFRGSKDFSSTAQAPALGIEVEMDLRGYPSAIGSPSPSIPSAEFINRPVYQFMYKSSSSSSGSGPGGGSSSGGAAGISADDYQQAIREIIECLQKDKGVYFHCIQGADRTGTLSWLILSLLGVDEANLCKEYELTSDRTRDDSSSRPFKQLVFYIKTFTTYEDPETGELLEAQSLQDMTTFWAMTKHADEGDGLGPFDPLSVEEILTLKELLLEGYDRSEETSPLLAGDSSLRSE